VISCTDSDRTNISVFITEVECVLYVGDRRSCAVLACITDDACLKFIFIDIKF